MFAATSVIPRRYSPNTITTKQMHQRIIGPDAPVKLNFSPNCIEIGPITYSSAITKVNDKIAANTAPINGTKLVASHPETQG